MLPLRAPMISVGQLYYNEDLNEYLVVTKNERGQVRYAGTGFFGHSEDQSFIERFKPVDPRDLTDAETVSLLVLLPDGTRLQTGFIQDELID